MRISTLRQLRDLVRGTRLEQGLSQQAVADRAGVSRKWLSEFERGNPNAQLGLVLAVLEALQIYITVNPADLAEPGNNKRDHIDNFIDHSTRVEGLL